MTGQDKALAGRRVLVVEDDFFIAEEMAWSLQRHGAEVIGPVSSVPAALAVIGQGDSIDAAVLDINLQGVKVFPVADALRERGVRFVFATGYDVTQLPARFADAQVVQKPVSVEEIAAALRE